MTTFEERLVPPLADKHVMPLFAECLASVLVMEMRWCGQVVVRVYMYDVSGSFGLKGAKTAADECRRRVSYLTRAQLSVLSSVGCNRLPTFSFPPICS